MSINLREEGIRLYQEGKYSAALTAFLQEDIDPAEDPELACCMGLCHARLRKTDMAIRLFREVLRTETFIARLYQARMLLSWLLVERGDIEEAEHNLRELLQEGVESPQAWSALGYCQWRRGRSDLALNSYNEAVGLDKTNSNAANGLGYLLAERGEDAGRAVELCRLAVAQDPNNMAYRDSLGWALFRAGEISEAVRYLTEALSGRPGDGIIENHLETVRTHDVEPKK